jgi:O-antigen/teichoic acid export membrane protein
VFFYTLFHLTLGLGIIRQMGRREYRIGEIAGTSGLLVLILGTLMFITFGLTVLIFRDVFYKDVSILYITVVMISAPFLLLLYYFSSILQGALRIRSYNFANQLPPTIILLLLISSVIVGDLTPIHVLVIGVAGIIIPSLYALYAVYRFTEEKWSVSKALLKDLVRDAWKLHIGGISTFLFIQANFFILNYYLPKADVGYYSIAYNLGNLIWFISVSVEISLYPRVSESQDTVAEQLTVSMCKQVLFLTLIAALAVAILSRPIILIYAGEIFLPAIQPLLILLPGVVLIVISKLLSPLWLKKGWLLQATGIACSTAILSIILNLVLVPKLGITGAALANTLSYCFNAILALYFYFKRINRRFWELFVFERNDWDIYWSIYKRSLKALRLG